ncbi:hypothetical protein V1525DRAFT_447547 [Lipomyces kononenkoae]|uniref:Uncharacterized protein n=1 Tax=Lipomyces kononenkoae TaxID=34357 RepID=A0ACC3TAM2_LIPKO
MLTRKKTYVWVLLVLVGVISVASYYTLQHGVGTTWTSVSQLLSFDGHSPSARTNAPNLVVFGDSWSDDASRPSPVDRAARVTGEKFYDGEAQDGRRHLRFGAGFGGRWSDGPVWPEYLCMATGCADYLNLAFGGAKITNRFVKSPVPDLVQQRDNFLAIKSVDASATDKHRSLSEELAQNRRTLLIFWFGINDLIQYISLLPTTDDRQQAVVSSVATLFDVAKDLANRFPQSNFLFMSAIDVTLLPVWQERYTDNDPNLHKFKEVIRLSQVWRQEMAMHVGNWNKTLGSIQYWDANAWYARSISGVTNNGFNNIKDKCFDHNTSQLCSTPDKYFFWDHVHLTTAAHKSIAAKLRQMKLWPPRP